MLKRLSGNKRSGERAGEWRGLMEDEFRWKERRSLEALQRKERVALLRRESGISMNNTHHMP